MVRSEDEDPRVEVILSIHRQAETDLLEAFRWYESKRTGLGEVFLSDRQILRRRQWHDLCFWHARQH